MCFAAEYLSQCASSREVPGKVVVCLCGDLGTRVSRDGHGSRRELSRVYTSSSFSLSEEKEEDEKDGDEGGEDGEVEGDRGEGKEEGGVAFLFDFSIFSLFLLRSAPIVCANSTAFTTPLVSEVS